MKKAEQEKKSLLLELGKRFFPWDAKSTIHKRTNDIDFEGNQNVNPKSEKQPQFIQTCSTSFREKSKPKVAQKWYPESLM